MWRDLTPIQKLALAALVALLGWILWNSMPARDIYVSDIKEWTINKWEWLGPQRDASVEGRSLMIGEKYYPKGIGVHAASEITVPVPPEYTRFLADVGVDDEIKAGAPSSVVFKVLGDGVVLYESPILKAAMPPYRVDVGVERVHTLTLVVTDASDGTNSDHADWGNARFAQ